MRMSILGILILTYNEFVQTFTFLHVCMTRLCYLKAGVSKSVCPWHIHVWVRSMFGFRWSLAVLALINIHFGLFILIGLLTWWILAVPRSKRIINFGPFRSGRWRAAEVCSDLPFLCLLLLDCNYSYAQVNYKREFTVDRLHCRNTHNGRKG